MTKFIVVSMVLKAKTKKEEEYNNLLYNKYLNIQIQKKNLISKI